MINKGILAATIVALSLMAGTPNAEAAACKTTCKTTCKPACKKAVCCKFMAKLFPDKTVKSQKVVCVRNVYKTECVKGCSVRVKYVETMYKTTYCSGRTKEWKTLKKA